MRTLAYNPIHALNAICPYFTVFPIEYPLEILSSLKPRGKVFDPFCGRGTTLYAARHLEIESGGIDSSPVAVSIAQAKLVEFNFEGIVALTEQLVTTTNSKLPSSPFFYRAFSKTTLEQLCAIRQGLLQLKNETSDSVALKAIMLGALHGPLSADVSNAGYISNQMPRTFSPKPDYAIRYWDKTKQIAPVVNIVDVVKRRLKRINTTKPSFPWSNVVMGDSTRLANYQQTLRDFSLVITSPPYLGMRTYIQDQWLRNWFVGGPESVDYEVCTPFGNHAQANFTNSLSLVWQNVSKSQSETLDLFIRFGGIPSVKSDPMKIILESIEQAKGWRIESVREAPWRMAAKRQAIQMGSKSELTMEFDFHFKRR